MKTMTILTLWVLSLAASEYKVLPESRVYFEATTTFFLVGDDHIKGTNRQIEGSIAPDWQRGEITIASGGFRTDNGRRDTHVAEILGDEPIRFTIESLLGVDETAQGSGVLSGVLQVRGVKRAVHMNVTWTRLKEGMLVEGAVSVAYADFGIERPTVAMGIVKKADAHLTVGGTLRFGKERP